MTEKVLVTGGNGFLALHIIKQLLEANYSVRATLRSLNKKEEVLQTLKFHEVPNLDRLSFVQADLTRDDNWSTAMAGITYVMSVAAPVFVNGETATKDVARAATDGTLRILKAAVTSNVKRVIMTANLGAVGFSNKNQQHTTTEADWTDPNESGLSLYEKSKLIAEKSAWNYLKKTNSTLEFVTVNAGAMLGGALDDHVSGSFGIVRNLINGTVKRIPNIKMNIVDVRDVADIHIRAMQTSAAAGKRFLAVGDKPISMPEIAALIKTHRPKLVAKIPTRTLPNWIIRIGSHFNQQAKEGRLFLEVNHNVSNQRAKTLLGWQPIGSNQETILNTVDSLIRANQI
ncbi:3-beta hydroxysteroid dehydrogenase [Pediococcus parvulus]|uniref:3-beta hydroxysteroid dehydrogenase n=1 Tax=Pediococcus parvulus TaxID=54062 RepID=A0AAP5TC35_9LACO|nr:NAD-dependent epimerase/dehydratase family protein [Pediococcus parvulus]MDV7695024.1 NAD-dependent epimerase/dehydratase family protein [Pediococcus parvulus]OAD64222.1 3-beta hydroxysteroid dehydrogenase [Pediococcus parvulus]